MGYIPPSYSNTFTTMLKIFENSIDPTYYWDFRLTENNSHTEDIINSSLQAVSVNGATFTEEGALLNSTEEQYLQIDPFSFGGQCSLELFFNASSSVEWNRILDFGNGNGQLSIVISSNKSNNGTLGLYLFDGANVADVEGSSLNNDVWYHLVITFDTDGKLRIYLDNVEENIDATNFVLPNVERTFNFLGKDTFNHNDKYFDGTIAFLRIWQDHTLSTSEINSLYENRDIKYEILNSIVYDVTVTSEGVFSLSGIPQLEVSFILGYTYIFHQSDSSNTGNQLVFVRISDDNTTLFTEGVTIMDTAGQPGAYSQIVLSDGFTGDLYYHSNGSAGNSEITFELDNLQEYDADETQRSYSPLNYNSNDDWPNRYSKLTENGYHPFRSAVENFSNELYWAQIKTSTSSTVTEVHGVITMGSGRGYDRYVTKVKIKYSDADTDTDADFSYVDNGATFTANNNHSDKKYILFSSPINATFIRIYPIESTTGWYVLRAALITNR